MVRYIAENEVALILLNKENYYSYLMTDLSLKTKVHVFFPQPQSRYKPSSNYRVIFPVLI